MKYLLSLFILSCTTIHPKIGRYSYEACYKLCKPKGGVDYVQTNVDLYALKTEVASETCVCKDRSAFEIAPVAPN